MSGEVGGRDRTSHPGQTVSSTFADWKSACLEKPDAAKKAELRVEAKLFFESLVRSKEMSLNGKVVRSKSVHNEALSLLIADLGPAFSTHHYSRVCAIYSLCGAIEGCRDRGLSLKITALLGEFLVGHCGPIQPDIDDPDEDSDESVRDAAVLCLSALTRAKLDDQEGNKILESVRLRLDLSQQGVKRRCASAESDEMDYDNEYGAEMPSGNDIRGGLSTLPRARRALCYDLVSAGIDGISSCCSGEGLKEVTKAQPELSSFASFAATCLHGESDPRCLLQLLQLLYALQSTFFPCFQISTGESSPSIFPTLDVFDAVAPYYPIQFTPPPNDTHGITRSGLHDALMKVLCNVGEKRTVPGTSGENGSENMLNLSAGLFLERLIPPDNDDSNVTNTVLDRQETIEDLTTLLLPSSTTSNCKLLNGGTVQELSSSLIITHADSSSRATSAGEDGRRNKELANACRTLISKVAYQLEVLSEGDSSLWNIFVRDTVRSHSPILASSPQSMRGRTAVAYLACLAASGGTRTLSMCLDYCVPPLLESLTSDKNDEEKVAAAAYGIGALMSSCRVALERGKKAGVALHPHPLQAYGSSVVRNLCDIVGVTDLQTGRSDQHAISSVSTKTAAIRSMESVLLATPSTVLTLEELKLICGLLEVLALALKQDPGASSESDSIVNRENKDLSLACSRTLGTVMGMSLIDSGDNSIEENPTDAVLRNSVLNDNSTIPSNVRDSIYPDVISSALSECRSSGKDGTRRYDWMALAFGCELSRYVSRLVVGELLRYLREALEREDAWEATRHPAITPATALSCVLSNGGAHAVYAFHESSPPGTTAMDIIDALTPSKNDSKELSSVGTSFKRNLRTGARVSMLELPTTAAELDAVENAVQLVYVLVPYLLPAYHRGVSDEQLLLLAKHALKVLPPLSDTESIKLDVMLPLLSAALSNDNNMKDESVGQSSESVDKLLSSMARPLSEYALCSAYDSRARSAAASCLHSIITKCQPRSSKDCLSHAVMKQVVLPAVVAAGDLIDKEFFTMNRDDVASFKDALNLTALLGSAAACRGKNSSKTADEIAKFLIQFACTGKADAPVNMDLSKLGATDCQEWTAWPAPLAVAASSAFGSMLSVKNGGPFWRQRLTHLAMKPVLQACSHQSMSQISVDTQTVLPPLGPLMVSCHIICSNKVTAISKSDLKELVSISLWGLTTCVRPHPNGDGVSYLTDAECRSIVALVLATVIKLMTIAPDMMTQFAPAIVPNLLLLYGGDDQRGVENIPLKLLVLQGLLNLTHLNSARRSLMQFKQAVVSLIAEGLDHPSSLLRQAAVDVNNAWSILTV